MSKKRLTVKTISTTNMNNPMTPEFDVAFCFGRFNPVHIGHIELWKTVKESGKKWTVGTNAKTHGKDNPLEFQEKAKWMVAIYPEIANHITSEQSVLTLASKLFEGLDNTASAAYVTDETDWKWSGQLLNEYNGKYGPHGYYNFKEIVHVVSPRLSTATKLREAALSNNEFEFYQASGVSPILQVNGITYYKSVVSAMQCTKKNKINEAI